MPRALYQSSGNWRWKAAIERALDHDRPDGSDAADADKGWALTDAGAGAEPGAGADGDADTRPGAAAGARVRGGGAEPASDARGPTGHSSAPPESGPRADPPQGSDGCAGSCGGGSCGSGDDGRSDPSGSGGEGNGDGASNGSGGNAGLRESGSGGGDGGGDGSHSGNCALASGGAVRAGAAPIGTARSKAAGTGAARSKAASPGAAGTRATTTRATRAATLRLRGCTRIAVGPLDRRSLFAAALGGLAHVALSALSMWFAGERGTLAPIWPPHAVVVLLMLRGRIGNELPLLAAMLASSFGVNSAWGASPLEAAVFACANLVEVTLIVASMRPHRRARQDMQRLPDLARFVWAGGLAGPLLSTLIALPMMGPGLAVARTEAITWFLTDSMAMLLLVPGGLLLIDRLRGTIRPPPNVPRGESTALLLGGMTCTFVVFDQANYPLVFLLQPITVLHAFRLGSLGTALHAAGAATVAAAMTWSGQGPIAATGTSALTQAHLLQAFIAANFLTGLPVSAILAGRDRMMGRLEAGKREIELLADNIADGILRINMAGVCTYASPSVQAVMGQTPGQFCAAPAAAALLHPDPRSRAGEAMARLLGGESEHERVTYRRPADGADGAPVFLEADCTLVRDPASGERDGVVVVVRDVTERVELELLLTRARRNAENAARAKSEFLANMSHEIRTPMNGVLGFAELMLQGELETDQRRFAELIVQSGRSMMMLLNDVLDLSKIESGQFAIDHAPVDLHASLAECAALHRPAAHRKGLTLDLVCDCGDNPECRYSEARPPWVLTDGLRLRQILLNLIGNAVKFTEAGHVRISYRVEPHEVRVSVADSGIGISPLQLETIFNPFTQGEASIARRFGGTGLGLSISRHLAALLGGRIEVESTPGEGSRFTLVLPALLAPPAAEAAQAAGPVGGALARDLAAAPLAPARILLVEDHDINRLLVTEMLERCGQEVDLAHDGNEAIAMVIDQVMRGRPYDLVLMDVQMPDCDGLAATRAIREEGIGPGLLPVIALTANAYPEDVAEARAAGMQGHLAKPVDFAQLARALQRWLPTRIVEDAPQGTPLPVPRASALARSPRLVARWKARRDEAIAAVRSGLAEGTLARPRGADGPGEIERLLHRVAGTAAMFGEPALGTAAAALERAIGAGGDAATCAALAAGLLAEAERSAPAAQD